MRWGHLDVYVHSVDNKHIDALYVKSITKEAFVTHQVLYGQEADELYNKLLGGQEDEHTTA